MTANILPSTEIQVLSGLEAVRKRPYMYVGVHPMDREIPLKSPLIPVQLLTQLLVPSVRAGRKGLVKSVGILLMNDGIAECWDDGPSWDLTEINAPWALKAYGRPVTIAETRLQNLHAGSKDDPEDEYEASAVTNALSEWLDFEVCQGGNKWTQYYERGVAAYPLHLAKQTQRVGTCIRFRIDPTIIAAQDFDLDQLISWCKGRGGAEFKITKGNDRVVIPATYTEEKI